MGGALVLACTSARAETNLVWSPSGTDRDVGTWQCAIDTTRVLTGSSYTSSTIVTFGSLVATASVFQCFADRPIGAGAGCPTANDFSQERMAPKSQARICIVERAPLPACWPTRLHARLEAAPQGQYVLFWACDLPRGVFPYALYFDWARAAEWAARGVLPKEVYDAAYGERSRPMTPEERVYAYGPLDANSDGQDDSLVSRYGARAVVAVNGTSLSRPVYAANADGTRNTTAVALARVAVGARCRTNDRLISATGTATNYYSVEGAENVATAVTDMLGKVYSVCTLTTPIGVN